MCLFLLQSRRSAVSFVCASPLIPSLLPSQEWELHDVREVMEVPAIRGSNLGGWLWHENWMNPAVSFQHFIDGTRVRGRAVRYPGVCASTLALTLMVRNQMLQHLSNFTVMESSCGASPERNSTK